jgi:glucose-1-phosphate thymidylyltransferase
MTKGIILAGGTGSRLHPLTLSVSKQLLPVYDKPMIYYPLTVLMLAGIRDVLVITTPRPFFVRETARQRQPMGHSDQLRDPERTERHRRGISHRRAVLGRRALCLVLGDNLFYGGGLSHVLQEAAASKAGVSCVFAQTGTRIRNATRRGGSMPMDARRPSRKSHARRVGLGRHRPLFLRPERGRSCQNP